MDIATGGTDPKSPCKTGSSSLKKVSAGVSKGGTVVKKIMIGTALLALVSIIPIPAMARVDVSINIGLPPPIVFAAPPELVVLPDTYIYVDPYIDVDLFFWNG